MKRLFIDSLKRVLVSRNYFGKKHRSFIVLFTDTGYMYPEILRKFPESKGLDRYYFLVNEDFDSIFADVMTWLKNYRHSVSSFTSPFVVAYDARRSSGRGGFVVGNINERKIEKIYRKLGYENS